MPEPKRADARSSVPWAWLAVIAAILFVGFIRLRVADVPLERDEGEYAYAGRLILEGIPPYAQAYNMKFPGTYYAYAAILAVFGQTPWGIHAGLLVVNAATILLVFAVGRRLLGAFAGSAAAVAFAFLSVDRWILGVFAHATHLVILAATAGLLLLLRAIESRRPWTYFWSGVLFGVSLLMKQHAIVYLPFCAALIFWVERDARLRTKLIGTFAIGSVVPLAVVSMVLMIQGVWGRFWLWSFQYARAYVSQIPLSEALPSFLDGLRIASAATISLWGLGAVGLLALWIARWEMKTRVILTGLLAASFLATCPGFYFRPHYFILLLPAMALLIGVAVESLRQTVGRGRSHLVAIAVSLAVLVAAIGHFVWKDRYYLFTMGTRELSRSMYGHNPFPEAVEVGKYLKDRTDKNDRVAVLGSEPEIYFYADRHGATGYIYTYALMEPQPFAASMQEEMIREIETAHPRYVVLSLIDRSWLATPSSNTRILKWSIQYVQQCYEPVGLVDVFSESESKIVWDDELRTYQPQSQALMYTFRRKSDEACTVRP